MRNDPTWQLITLAMAALVALIAWFDFQHWLAPTVVFPVAVSIFGWFFLHGPENDRG